MADKEAPPRQAPTEAEGWEIIAQAAAGLAGEPQPPTGDRLRQYVEAVQEGQWTLPKGD